MTITIINADCREALKGMASNSVHMVCTSPPYYGLRDYGTAQWEGGDAGCDHRVGDQVPQTLHPAAAAVFATGMRPGVDAWACSKCGARRIDSQIGLENSPEEYIATMVQVFREVRRVLRDDGTCWVNMGDSYNNFRSQMGPGQAVHGRDDLRGKPEPNSKTRGWRGLKEKDLLMMPARLALALQADGWWLRSAICWSKPNPMPESVVDRPTSAYEMVYLLAKGQWKSRIIKFADLPSERFHFLQNLGLRPTVSPLELAPSGGAESAIVQNCVRLAASIFDGAQRKQEFSLPPFYAEVWQKGAGDIDSDFVRALPIEHRAAASSARFLMAQTTAKEFMTELNSLRVTLPEGDDFLIGRIAAEGPHAPSLDSDGKGTITIHNAGEICEIDFVHSVVVTKSPTGCKYFYDADAVREEALQPIGVATRTPNSDYTAGGFTNNGTGNSTLGSNQGVPYRNLRNVWTIATAPFSEWTPQIELVPVPASEAQALVASKSEGGGDIARITSPDCSLHAAHPDRVPKGFYDGLSEAQLRSMRGTGGGRDRGMPSGSSTIQHTPALFPSHPSTNDCSRLEGAEIATPHSTESRRTDLDHLFSERAISSEETASDTPRTEPGLLRLASSDRGIVESRSGNGSSSLPHPETVAGSAHISSSACCCGYYRKVTTKTSHFATFPPALAERCIRAGTSERGCCAACGAPWVRSTVAEFIPQQDISLARGIRGAPGQKPMDASSNWDGVPRGTAQRITTGWAPSCKCGTQETRPAVLLDPFAGAGTVGLCADRLQRDAVLIELSPAYCDMLRNRLTADAPLFMELAAG